MLSVFIGITALINPGEIDARSRRLSLLYSLGEGHQAAIQLGQAALCCSSCDGFVERDDRNFQASCLFGKILLVEQNRAVGFDG